jgi:hypothetical protein
MLDTHGRNWPLDAEDIVERAAVLAAQGMQVVALARKSHGGTKLCAAELNGGLTFIGMVGIAPS